MKAGVLFCGGCNPCYDRLACRSQFVSAYPDIVFEDARTDGRYDFVLAICGCTASCVKGGSFGVPSFLITSPADVQRVRAGIERLLSENSR